MKKHQLFAGLAMLALAVSCVEGVKLPGVDVKLNSSSTVSSEKLFSLSAENASTASDGTYYIESAAPAPLNATVTLGSTIPGSLKIDNSSLPEAAFPVQGTMSNVGVALTVENSSSAPIKLAGKAVFDGKEVALNPAVASANSSSVLAFVTDPNAKVQPVPTTANLVPLADPDKAVTKGSKSVEIKELEISDGSKAAAPSSVALTVSAKYCAAFVYPEGTKLHLDRSFSDLGLTFDRVQYPLNEYDVHMEVVNSIPFDIYISATSADGISGSIAQPILAGSIENPVTTSVILHVVDNSGKAVSHMDQADLSLDLVAVSGGSALKKGQKLEINLDKLTIVKL